MCRCPSGATSDPMALAPVGPGDELVIPTGRQFQLAEVAAGLTFEQGGTELRLDEQPLPAALVIAHHVRARPILVRHLGVEVG